jgi:hypothetical protein
MSFTIEEMSALKIVEKKCDVTGNAVIYIFEFLETKRVRFVSLNTTFLLSMRRFTFSIRFHVTGVSSAYG